MKTRRPRHPEALKAEAKARPGGWVYEIVGEFGPDDAVPPTAIRGAWKVDQSGEIVGEFLPNARFRPADSPSGSEISEALVVWTGWGSSNRPVRDEHRLVAHFGEERARDLMPILRRLEDEFYESDVRFTVADLAEMGNKAASRFRELHPELTQEANESLAWCYSYDFK